MIQSMTGYARVEGTVAGRATVLEIRSVNHRYLDVKVRAHRERPMALEGQVRSALSEHFTRGSIEVLIENPSEGSEETNAFSLNLSAVAHYYESLKSAQKILGLEDKVVLKDVFVFPDVVQRVTDRGEQAFPGWDALEPLFSDACRALSKERQREGAHLFDQLSGLVRGLRKGVDELENLQTSARSEIQSRVKARIEKALQGMTIDPAVQQRIAHEAVLLVERSDVSEEIHRLKGHLNHFSELLGQGGAVGRKLEFLAQEILREINTVGSKSVDLEMSRSALHTKSLADQVREQVLNLE